MSKHAQEYEKIFETASAHGLFPEAVLENNLSKVKLLHQNYHQTYIEKDVRDLKEVGNVLDFDQVWKLAQQKNSELLSYTNISRETGLAFNTVKKYISVLSASYNIVLLASFTHNIQRRMVKSPKIFSADMGFFNHSTGIYGYDLLTTSGFIGKTFESILIMEFFKQERSFLLGGNPYFFRTSAGSEIDLVVEKGPELFAYEFKYTRNVRNSDFDAMRSLMASSKNRLTKGFLVTRVPHAEKFDKNLFAVPWWLFCA